MSIKRRKSFLPRTKFIGSKDHLQTEIWLVLTFYVHMVFSVHVGELACDYDYHISWGYKCIKVHITSVTWSDAMYSCLRENGTLLELRPPASYKQADITQLLTSHKLTDMWIETRKHKSGYRSRSIVKGDKNKRITLS